MRNHDGLPADGDRMRMLRDGTIISIPGRCVQCGICSWSCPAGIDVRSYSRSGLPVTDPRCLRCGMCVSRCPRATLQAVLSESAA